MNYQIVTIVTDPYTAHPLWFLRLDQNFIVFSERLKQTCLNKGISPANLTCLPFILDGKFSTLATDEQVQQFRAKHGFGAKRIVLVLGGGDGIPNGTRILRALQRTKADFEIGFVCGKNQELFRKAVAFREKHDLQHLKVFGFVDFVYELLSISDIVITKCGASTFIEILMSKKLPLVSSYLWEQEKGNVEFLVDNQLGIYEPSVNQLPALLQRLLTDEEFYNSYHNAILTYEVENGTSRVGEHIWNLLDGKNR